MLRFALSAWRGQILGIGRIVVATAWIAFAKRAKCFGLIGNSKTLSRNMRVCTSGPLDCSSMIPIGFPSARFSISPTQASMSSGSA